MGDICRFCLLLIATDDISNDNVPNETKIKAIIPEIDLTMTTAFSICNSCSSLLTTAYTFKLECLKTEEDLKQYIKQCNLSAPIDLSNYNDYRLQRLTEITSHMKTEDEDNVDADCVENCFDVVNTCDKCLCVFHDTESYDEHRAKCILYKRDDSGESFQSAKDIQEDFVEQIEMKPNIYEDSDELFIIESDHSSAPRFHCDICNTHYVDEESLHTHNLTHSSQEGSSKGVQKLQSERYTNPYTCCICTKAFSRHHTFRQHMRSHRPYICDICGKEWTAPSDLVIHMRIHTGEKPYQCEVCGNSYAQRSGLNTHRKATHDPIKPCLCNQCGKIFRNKESLKAHLKLHKYENAGKTFRCEFENCGKMFHSKVRRNQHMVWHGEKKVSCSQCEKRFFTNSGLKRHMPVHTGEKPYECDVCHKTFSQDCNLKVHLRSHRPKTKNVCKESAKNNME